MGPQLLSLWDEIVLGKTNQNKRVTIKKVVNKEFEGDDHQVFDLRMKDVCIDSSQCTLIVIRDIQELSKIEYARSLEKLTEIMIASTSHDMRTPLNTTTNML